MFGRKASFPLVGQVLHVRMEQHPLEKGLPTTNHKKPMANIISKDNLDEKVRTFLENLKDTTNEKYLIVQFRDEKIVVSSLNDWLKEEE